MLIEYNLEESSFACGVIVRSRSRIEQSATPQAMAWHPEGQGESFLMMVCCLLRSCPTVVLTCL